MSTTIVGLQATSGKRLTTFEVNVSKETFKFNAAHFVAFSGYRERLHGHNYQISVRLLGSRKIGSDGYLIDFGDVKKVAKDVCKQLNDHFLCPSLSDVIEISVTDGIKGKQDSVKLVCEDGAEFVFPKRDCVMLPIVHATAEELAIYLWGEILTHLDAHHLVTRGIHTMEVNVAEAVGQEALFRMEIPDSVNEDEKAKLTDVRNYIKNGGIIPLPCSAAPKDKEAVVSGRESQCNCSKICTECQTNFSKKLMALAEAMNSGKFQSSLNVQVKDLEAIMENG